MTRRLPCRLRLVGWWLALVTGAGCIELDFFLFEPDGARSVADDYHGLPLHQGPDEPPWLATAAATVEREVYLAVPSAEVLPAGSLAGAGDYLHGVFLPAPQDCPVEDCPLIERPPTILYQHGNSGNLWRYWPRAVVLWTMGANVFIYSYRGYGLSPGEPTKAGILEDADTAMAYLMGRSDVDSDRLVAYGFSMGGLPTSYLVGRSAWRGQFAAVVLEAALDGPETAVNLSTGTEFPRGFFLDKDTEFFGPAYMKGASLPILHLHGRQDGLVVLAQAENYYAVLEGRPEYTHFIGRSNRPAEEWIARCGHRNITSWTFASDVLIANYWDNADNPGHCCVHPLEWLHVENADFIQRVGSTTGAAAYAAAMDYQQLITRWLERVVP